jgi:hypothetical protein
MAFVTQRGRGRAPPAQHAPSASSSSSTTLGQPGTAQHASHSARQSASSSLLSVGAAESARPQQRRRGSPSDAGLRESLDWNVVFPGRAADKARASPQASSSARSEWTLLAEEALSADEMSDVARHCEWRQRLGACRPALLSRGLACACCSGFQPSTANADSGMAVSRHTSGAPKTASPSALTLPPLHDGTGRFVLSDDEADDEAELSPQALLRSASADRWEGASHASSALLSDSSVLRFSDEAPDLAASLLLPSDSSAAWSGLTPDDDGYASELHFDGIFAVARRGASDEAVASWASSSRLVQEAAPHQGRSASQLPHPEAELTDEEWTASAGDRTQMADDEAAFDALLAESPAAQSAGLATLPHRKRAPKRRHRLAGGSQRSKRSATDTTRSVGNGPRLAAQPEAPTPVAPAYQPDRQAGTGTRLMRAVLHHVFAADEDVLDAVLHDAGPLAVPQPAIDECTARRRAPHRGFSHERSQHAGDVADVAEESETETQAESPHGGDRAADFRPRSASLSLVASAALAHQARLRALEPTALETLQAALVDGSLRVPAPLRLLGQLARAFHLAVWGSLEQKDRPQLLDEHDELPHLQEVPRLWNGGLHPALRARRQSHDSR